MHKKWIYDEITTCFVVIARMLLQKKRTIQLNPGKNGKGKWHCDLRNGTLLRVTVGFIELPLTVIFFFSSGDRERLGSLLQSEGVNNNTSVTKNVKIFFHYLVMSGGRGEGQR